MRDYEQSDNYTFLHFCFIKLVKINIVEFKYLRGYTLKSS